MKTFPSFHPNDIDDTADATFWELVFEAAHPQDRLDEQSEDYRLELAEFYGIAAAEQRGLEF
ncbi:hypothetical protein [Asticcacaulis sp. W401b]|uniref:hypothetical protein n=1 Tax=Asticcacaulis sp. W401b TaxID=3388666 RepID=UPI0039704E53